ncbi:MAG: type II toxin-antitoxin system HicA family toxin [Armatimonadetes bacterium]|nr:type II toxin-antitoxin system HicA family toxin [Armatimonadota bacterium]
MRRATCVRELVRHGCRLRRHGKNHDVYENPAQKRVAPVPRHPEIPETLCALIRRQLGIQ